MTSSVLEIFLQYFDHKNRTTYLNEPTQVIEYKIHLSDYFIYIECHIV